MRTNLTKKDLVNIIYMQVGFSKQISENIIDEFFSLIITNLQKEGKIKISKFGTFSIRSREKRLSRNPKTGTAVLVNAKYHPYFRASKHIKESLNK